MTSLVRIIESLNKANVEYVIVGGVAVIVHGHSRTTMDIDFVIRLTPDNVQKAVVAFDSIGFRPRAPVDAKMLGDEQTRQSWIEEKNMLVFTFTSNDPPYLSADVFIKYPMDFENLLARSKWETMEDVPARVCSYQDLLMLKRLAGRVQDLEDIRLLEIAHEEP
ncbi:hypothetical protein BH10PLA1_BH10PLA1_01920 [soil metagenome]